MNFAKVLNSQLFIQNSSNLYSNRDNQSLVQRLNLSAKLEVHKGCVNTISWSDEDCSLILSGSDDQTLAITDAFRGLKKTTIYTGHKSNIFCAKFMPQTNSQKVVSCSSAGDIYLSDIKEPTLVNSLNRYQCHGDKTAYELRTFEREPSLFMSCGQDGTCKLFDIRLHSGCNKPYCNDHTLLKLPTGITAIALNPLVPYHLVCAGLDGLVRFYDRRMLSIGSSEVPENQSLLSALKGNSINGLFAAYTPQSEISAIPTNTLNSKRITSLQYDCSGAHVLVSYQSDNIYLLDWRQLTDKKQNADDDSNKECCSQIVEEVPSTSSMFGRKIRIHTDWSDTGPNSVPQNESSQSDPRSFLARRLTDWFTNLAERRGRVPDSSSQAESSTDNAETETAENAPGTDPVNRENIIESESEQENSGESGENLDEIGRLRADESAKTRANSLWFSNSLISSKIKLKQAIRFENTAISGKPMPKVKMVYTGHRNSRTIIKECNFWGNEYVMSGSDCGHIFFWNKKTGRIENLLEADKHVVNCVQENPSFPVLASSGIDYNVKLWEPTLTESMLNHQKIETVTQRNKTILDENRDTLFIPVQFMLPALRLFGANLRSNRSQTNRSNVNSSTNHSDQSTDNPDNFSNPY